MTRASRQFGGRHWRWALASLLAMSLLQVVGSDQSTKAIASPLLSVTEFHPDIKWGGLALSVDVHPSDPERAIVASASGGLFLTGDGGTNWSHVDSLPPFRMSDVRFAPEGYLIMVS